MASIVRDRIFRSLSTSDLPIDPDPLDRNERKGHFTTRRLVLPLKTRDAMCGDLNLMLGFSGAKAPGDEKQEEKIYSIDPDPTHPWNNEKLIQVVRRKEINPGSRFEKGVCGCLINGTFVPLTTLFGHEFEKK